MDIFRYKELEEYIEDMLVEQQLKLGYIKETVRLYYPLKSLNRMLGMKADEEEMLEFLDGFCGFERGRTGQISVSSAEGRFCIAVSDEVSAYVNKKLESPETVTDPKVGFLKELIELLSKHGVGMQQVEQLFKQYSDSAVIKKSTDDEFDYLAYFEDGKPDQYRYCLVDEGCHIIYHRFSKGDYEEMYGQD